MFLVGVSLVAINIFVFFLLMFFKLRLGGKPQKEVHIVSYREIMKTPYLQLISLLLHFTVMLLRFYFKFFLETCICIKRGRMHIEGVEKLDLIQRQNVILSGEMKRPIDGWT